jgi:hypothetical protein
MITRRQSLAMTLGAVTAAMVARGRGRPEFRRQPMAGILLTLGYCNQGMDLGSPRQPMGAAGQHDFSIAHDRLRALKNPYDTPFLRGDGGAGDSYGFCGFCAKFLSAKCVSP